MTDELLPIIEAAVADLMVAFDVSQAPVPLEILLQRPKAGMWKEVDLTKLSAAFLNVQVRFGPRMSIARLLARSIVGSEWGKERKLPLVVITEEGLRALARAIVMPRSMLDALPDSYRVPMMISVRFEAPEEDVRLRFRDLGYILRDIPPSGS